MARTRSDTAPGGGGPLIGSRGDVDIQRDIFDPVKTPWRQAWRLSLAYSISYTCLLVIVSLIWIRIGGFRHWCGFIRDEWAWLIVMPFVFIMLAFAWVAWQYYTIVIKNPRWPPPMAQVDPLETGFTGARSFPRYAEEKEEMEHAITFQGFMRVDDGSDRIASLETFYPDRWERYAKALTRSVLPARFSANTAHETFKIPRSEFEPLRYKMIAAGMAETTSHSQNAHTKLNEVGREWFRQLLNQAIPVVSADRRERPAEST